MACHDPCGFPRKQLSVADSHTRLKTRAPRIAVSCGRNSTARYEKSRLKAGCSHDWLPHKAASPTPYRRRMATGSRVTVLPSGSPDTVGASDFGYFGAHQLQGYPAYMCPCPTLQVRGCLHDSCIHYSTPVYPDAIQAIAPTPHIAGTEGADPWFAARALSVQLFIGYHARASGRWRHPLLACRVGR
jgi:hypothetical protein